MSHLLLRARANFLRASSNTTGGLRTASARRSRSCRRRRRLPPSRRRRNTRCSATASSWSPARRARLHAPRADLTRVRHGLRVADAAGEQPEPAVRRGHPPEARGHAARLLVQDARRVQPALGGAAARRRRRRHVVGRLAGRAVAGCAQKLGLPLTVVMPARTPVARRKAIEQKGGTVVIHGTTLADARAEAIRLAESSDEMTLLEPHDDPHVVAGQATAGLEIVRSLARRRRAAPTSTRSSRPLAAAHHRRRRRHRRRSPRRRR